MINKLKIVSFLLVISMSVNAQRAQIEYISFMGSTIPKPEAMNLIRISLLNFPDYQEEIKKCNYDSNPDWEDGNIFTSKYINGSFFVTIKSESMFIIQFTSRDGSPLGNLLSDLQTQLLPLYSHTESDGRTIYKTTFKNQLLIKFVMERNSHTEIVGVYVSELP